jgi:hypothetical protein
MARMLSPDDACKGVDVQGASYDGNVINVSNPAHARRLREGGYTDASISGAPARAAGYRCTVCAFRGWFTTCGRCGSPSTRADVATPTTGEAA